MSTCNYTICKILLSAEDYQVPSAKITRKKVFKEVHVEETQRQGVVFFLKNIKIKHFCYPRTNCFYFCKLNNPVTNLIDRNFKKYEFLKSDKRQESFHQILISFNVFYCF